LDVLLAIAARFGIVVQEDEVLAEPKHSDVADLEAELSRTFVNRDQIAALLCTGLSHGNPLAKSDALMDPYLRVMNGDSTRFRVNFGLRALGLHARSRILEVTAGPGMYGRIAAARQAGIAHTVWPVGPAARMGGDPPLPPDLPEHVFDAIVLFNGLRWSPIPERLGELKKLMRRPSVLLIDDLFLQDDDVSAEFALDWVTHGGAAFMTLVELTTALSMQGFDVEVKSVPGSVYARIVVARLL